MVRRRAAVRNMSLIHALAAMVAYGLIPAATAQQPGPRDQVVVTANLDPVPFENLSRTVTVLTREEISRMPVRSIAEVLDYASSVEVRSRVPFGLQADMSVRGSSYSQVLVLVDGIRMNDSQTAHHNSDFPVQLQEIERIEILQGAGSSLYGADAFGGIINIITRRETGNVNASLMVGQFGFFEGSFGAGFRKAGIDQSFRASAARSSGFMYDRDFSSLGFSSRTGFGKSSIFVSHRRDDLGANGFYGPAPSREWENQTVVSFEQHLAAPANGVLRAYYRTHGDTFLYDIRTPDRNENNHRTHEVGTTAKSQWSLADTAVLHFGAEAGADVIRSSNLGNHEYGRLSLFGEVEWKPKKQWTIYPGFRWDHYTNFGTAANPSLSASWWVAARIRLRSSVGHAFRIPTFTELYYHDPNNEANPNVGPESSWSGDAGVDFLPAGNWVGSLTFFLRNEHDVIDWIRRTPDEKWRTANIRTLRVRGMVAGLEHSFDSGVHLAVHYTQMESAAGKIDYFSKYALDTPRYSWAATGSVELPFSLTCGQKLAYTKRANGMNYWRWDLRLERRFREITAMVDATNLFDSRYQEVPGVDMPGRWFIVGLTFDIPGHP
jgi:outer membrane cobalamin receptor